MNVIVLMPVYNDWESAALLWDRLDQVAGVSNATFLSVLCVDDGSHTRLDRPLDSEKFRHIARIHVLRLKRNVGHQRAFAIGLTYICQHLPCDAVLCMDADGQDRAEDAARLLSRFEALGRVTAVFASRRKRLEGRAFQTGYFLFRLAHRVLVGFAVQIGNFSVISWDHVAALTVSPDLWSHYAATFVKLRLPMATLPANRGSRLAGRSKMNYVSLVAHGLSAMSVFAEVVATRVLIGGSVGLLLVAILCVGLISLHSYHGLPALDWMTTMVILSFLVTANAVIIALASAFGVLARRDQLGFLPVRDAGYFVSESLCVYECSRIRL